MFANSGVFWPGSSSSWRQPKTRGLQHGTGPRPVAICSPPPGRRGARAWWRCARQARPGARGAPTTLYTAPRCALLLYFEAVSCFCCCWFFLFSCRQLFTLLIYSCVQCAFDAIQEPYKKQLLWCCDWCHKQCVCVLPLSDSILSESY